MPKRDGETLFREREQKRWDDQLDADSSAGRLDFLFNEAGSESAKSDVPVSFN